MKRAGLLVGLVLIVAVAWWLVESGGGEGRVDVIVGEAPGASEPVFTGEVPAETRAIDAFVDGGSPQDAPADKGNPSPRPWETKGPFTGRVEDERGSPISGATIVFLPGVPTLEFMGLGWNAHGDALQDLPRTTTDPLGRFEIRGPHLDSTSGAVDDYEVVPFIVAMAPGRAMNAHKCMGYARGEYDAGTIALERAGGIVGRAVDDNGNPMGGVHVHVVTHDIDPVAVDIDEPWFVSQPFSRIGCTETSANGRFELQHLWNGTVRVQFRAASYLDGLLAKEIVTPGELHDAGDVILSRGGAITGWVTDGHGKPIRDAVVYVDKRSGWSRPADKPDAYDVVLVQLDMMQQYAITRVTTDEDGWFEASGLEPTNHEVLVDADGFEPEWRVDLLPDALPLSFTLEPQSVLELTILAGSGDVIADGGVKAWRRTGGGGARGGYPELEPQRLDDGRFIVERVGTVRTVLLVSAPGYASELIEIPGVEPGTRIERTVSLTPHATVSGRVLSDQGVGIHEARLVAKAAERRIPKANARSGERGEYLLSGLGTGEWTVTADAHGFTETSRTLSIGPEDDVSGFDVVLQESARIRGTVYDGDGQPKIAWSHTAVQVSSDGEHLGSRDYSTNEKGAYDLFDLPAGRWRLHRDPPVVVDVAPGEDLEVDIHLHRHPIVRGRVFVGGMPSPRAGIFARDSTGRLAHTTLGGENGAYELKLGRIGDFDIRAYGSTPPSGRTLPVSVSVGWGDVVDLDFHFSGVRVSGVVRDSMTGESVPGATVVIVHAELPEAYARSGNANDPVYYWPRSDDGGRISLEYVQIGPNVVKCNADGYVKSETDLQVPPEGIEDLVIELTPGATLSGTICYPSGVPLPDDTMVQLIPVSGGAINKLSHLRAGRFVISGVPPDTYRVELFPPRKLAEQLITLTAGQTLEVELVVTP